jgi:acyl carrier protein
VERAELVQVLRDRAVELFEVAPEAVTEEASFATDLGMDSLDVVELLVVVEEALGVELMETPPADVPTVGSLADLVLEKQTG